MTAETKTCAWCGEEFARTWQKPGDWAKARHCSISCGRKTAWNGKRAPVRFCEGCGIRLKSWGSKRCPDCAFGTLAERFDAKVERFEGGCWFWLGYIQPSGYGQFRADGRTKPAHRVSYEMQIGPIPEGAHLDHLCRNPSCVNPAHLEPVTAKENARRGLQGELKMTCANGHPWIPENWTSNGPSKCCAICHRERVKAEKKRKRSERVEASADTPLSQVEA